MPLHKPQAETDQAAFVIRGLLAVQGGRRLVWR